MTFSDFLSRIISRDYSLWGLLLGNLFTVVVAVSQGWDHGEVMWVYLGQSVIIGVTSYLRILGLKEFSTEGCTVGDRPVPETEEAKRSWANAWMVVFNLFLFCYGCALWEKTPLFGIGFGHLFLIMLCVAGFAGSHGYSLKYNANKDFKQKKPNIGTLSCYPYLRLIPIVVYLAIGAHFGRHMPLSVLVKIMLVKTLVDVWVHWIEHRLFQKAKKKPLRMED